MLHECCEHAGQAEAEGAPCHARTSESFEEEGINQRTINHRHLGKVDPEGLCSALLLRVWSIVLLC